MIYSEVRMEQVTVQEEQTEQRNPDEKHLVTFDSELRRLKSNKKPVSNTHIPFNHWKSHATLTLLATQDLPTFGYNMIDPLKSWCWGSILFYPFKISRFS